MRQPSTERQPDKEQRIAPTELDQTAERARQAYEQYCENSNSDNYARLYEAARERYLAYEAAAGQGAQIPPMYGGRIPLGPPVFDWPADQETAYQGEAYWVATGPERGDCGHEHKSEADAQRCAMKDRRACSRAGGSSDRQPERRARKRTLSYRWAVMFSPEELKAKYARAHRLLFSLPDPKSPKPTGE
jgi:hypothetical protein